MKRLSSCLAALLMLVSVAVHAEDMLMVRSAQAFPETMLLLQDALKLQGYQISRVQHVDVGLTTFGFKTDLYRVVFFAKHDELAALAETHPALIAYLPYPVAIFAEGSETLVAAANPGRLAQLFPDPALAPMFARWEKDLRAVMDAVQRGE